MLPVWRATEPKHTSCLGVQSRGVVGWIDFEPFGLLGPLPVDKLERRETLECLEPAAKIVGVDEVLKVPSELVVVVIVEALDSRVPGSSPGTVTRRQGSMAARLTR